MEYVKSTITLFKNQQGAALPMVLILMVLMIILSAAAYQVSQGNTGIIAMAASSEKAFYAAEQGYNRTLWRLNNEKTNFLAAEDSSPEEIPYDGKPYNLYELTAGSNYRLHVLVPLVEIAGTTAGLYALPVGITAIRSACALLKQKYTRKPSLNFVWLITVKGTETAILSTGYREKLYMVHYIPTIPYMLKVHRFSTDRLPM